MHCNPEDFRQLCDELQLQGAEPNLSSSCLELVERLKDDLRDLLATPAKSDSARQTLAKGTLKIDGTELKLSQRFMNTSAQVADELGLDEMLAAQFVFYGSESSQRLGIELHQSALLLFYLRRAHILEAVRLLVALQPTNFDLASILGKEPQLILRALVGVQKSIEDLHERLQRGKFLQNDQDAQFVPTIETQRDFLVAEHQTLACILHSLVRSNKVGEALIVEVIKEAALFSSYSSHLFAYVLPLAAWFSAHTLSPSAASSVWEQSWRLQWWRGGLATLYCAYNSDDTLLRASINDGGLELLGALAKDTSVGTNSTFNDFALLRARVPPLGEPVSAQIRELLVPELEAAVAAFIGRNAHILREMRLSEEDAYLSGESTTPHSTRPTRDSTRSTRPGVDLERFFLFVSYLYQGRPDSSLEFWHKPGGPLYGFLKWGSTIQVAFISAAFNEMLASLAQGPQAALAASKMLQVAPAARSRSFALCWTYIHDLLKYYAAKLAEDKAVLDDSTVLVLFSYLRLVYQIVSDSPEARATAWAQGEGEPQGGLIGVLFSLLRFQSPLYAPLFTCISGFVDAEHVDELWKMVDDWAFTAMVYKLGGNGLFYSPSSEPRFDSLLASLSDVTGFVSLVSQLAAHTSSVRVPSSPYLRVYCEFVAKVFCWTKTTEPPARALQESCLCTFSAFLQPLDGKLVQVPLALAQSLNMDKLVEGEGTLSEFLRRFPYEAVMELCFKREVYEVLFGMLRPEGEESSSAPGGPSPSDSAVIAACDLIRLLLSNPRHSFGKPVLYNLSVVPHLATYWSSSNRELALSAVKLLQSITANDLFVPLATRRDRIVAVLETAPNVGNIKMGLVEQFGRAGPELQAHTLELLLQGIQTNQATFAHYLLGFRLGTGTNALSIDANLVGAIGSGCSLLEVACGLLKSTVRNMDRYSVDLDESRLAFLLSEVLLKLVHSPLSSSLTLDFLRQDDFLLELLKLEPVASARTLWQGERLGEEAPAFDSAQAFYYFFKRRAALLEMVALEFHTSAKRQTFSLLGRYVKVLMNLQSQSSRSVLHFLDFLKFRPEQPPSVPAQIRPSDPDAPLDLERLRLLLLVSPVQSELDLEQLYTRALVYLKIKTAQLDCLRPWSQLVPILVNDTRNVAREQDTTTFVLETIQTLVPKLVESSRSDLTFCKPLASLLVLLLERYLETHAEDLIGLDRLHSLYRAAVMCIPSSLTFASLRTDLYVIGYQVLQMTLRHKHKRALYADKLAVISGQDRILESICVDALSQQQDLRLVALVLLQTLATVAREAEASLVQDILIRTNMLQLLVQSLATAALVEAKVTLCLMLELAQSRAGAEFLLQNGLIDKLSQIKALVGRQEYDLYLIVFQLLTALVLSLGEESGAPEQARKFIEQNYQQVTIINRATHLGPDRCATAVARLVALVGYKHV